jgi:hypothetical protein
VKNEQPVVWKQNTAERLKLMQQEVAKSFLDSIYLEKEVEKLRQELAQ